MGVPTGGNVGQARGSISIDTSQAQRAPAIMQGVAQGVNRAMGSVNTSVNKAQLGINNLSGAFQGLAGAFGVSFGIGAVVQIGRATIELAKMAAQAEVTERSFDRLAAGVGQSSDEILAGMREASRGVITDTDLILGANRAIASGVADTGAELNQILQVARATGQAFGKDTTYAFSRIVEAVAKLEPELIDELGITMRLDTVFRSYAASVGKTADELTEVERRQAMLNEVMKQAQPFLDAMGDGADNAAESFGRHAVAVDNLNKALGRLFQEGTVNSTNFWTRMIEGLTGYLNALNQIQGQLTGRDILPGVSGTAPWGTRGAPRMGPAYVPRSDSPEVVQAKLDWTESVADLNKKTRKDIENAERDHGRTRTGIIESYNTSITREAEDFALQRQRQEQELADSILRINRDAARREQRMAEDLARGIARAEADSAERVANARRDHDKRLAELDEDFKRNQERREEDFRDDMLSAAGRLDAIALLELRKGRARELADAKEAHEEQRKDLDEQLQERLDDEAESLDKSIRQQREAYDRQLADGREADAQRLEDMKADFAKRQEQEDIDRGIRLSRQAQDHAAQLRQMDAEHASRLAQIHIHAQDERDEIDMEHKQAMIDLKVQNDEWLKELERVEKARRKIYDDVWDLDPAGRRGSHPSENDPYIDRPFPTYASGGYVPRTGLAMLHRGETVLPASQSWNMGGSRGPITIGEINIDIAGTTDMGAGELRPMIYEVLVDALEQVAGRR